MLKICSTVLILLFISGCVQIQPLPSGTTTSEHVVEKNYTKNVKQTVYVGQSIVKVKDYYTIESSTPYVEASNDFKIEGTNYFGKGHTKISILGEITVDNKKYISFLLWKQGGCTAGLIDKNGNFSGKLLFGSINYGMRTVNNSGSCTAMALSPQTFTIIPGHTTFNIVSNKRIGTNNGFINYELLYGGTNGNSFSVTYREYTPDNLARPAFYQDLTFSNSSKHIRYKNMRIKIHNVDNEEITYTVVED